MVIQKKSVFEKETAIDRRSITTRFPTMNSEFQEVKSLTNSVKSKVTTIRSVEKALDIIEWLAHERTMVSLKSLSKSVGLNQSTVFRILKTLEQRGYVEQDTSTKQYGLGMKVIELGSSLLEEMEVYTQALPFMQKIRDECNETVALGILKEKEVFILASAAASRPDSLYIRQGDRHPVYCTALGRVLTAYLAEDELDDLLFDMNLHKFTEKTVVDKKMFLLSLEEVRATGIAIEDEEFIEGNISLAVPLRNHQAKVLGGLSIAIPKTRFATKRDELSSLLKRFGSYISQRFGYLPKDMFLD